MAEVTPIHSDPHEIGPLVRLFRTAISHRNLAKTAIISAAVTLAIVLLSVAGRRLVYYATNVPVLFESQSGEWLSVSATDQTGQAITQFMVPGERVWLPAKEIQLDVSAVQRLNYGRTIDLAVADGPIRERVYHLEAPQSHRWMVDGVVWHQVIDLVRHGQSVRPCLALRSSGLILLDTAKGDVLWTFQDPDEIAWGNSVRGCPATFQPDRCAVIPDINANHCQEIVVPHPEFPELLCLDSGSGEMLWRTNLIESANLKIPNAASLCPIVLQCLDRAAHAPADLNIIVAPHVAAATGANDRWMMSVETKTGSVQWSLPSQQASDRKAALPRSTRPLHVQWGALEQRPLEFSNREPFYYFDDYWRTSQQPALTVPRNSFEADVRLGTERPFAFTTNTDRQLHWIDGCDWHVCDPPSGKLLTNWDLQGDCEIAPKLLRVANNQTHLLTTHSLTANNTKFVAWDLATREVAWEQSMITCDLNRLPQSYLSRSSDFPIVADLDGDKLGYNRVLANTFTSTVDLFFLALPLVELARTGWRRRVAFGLYLAVLVILPAYMLLTRPTGVIQTTYTTYQWWHLFWFALLPTGAILFLILTLSVLIKGIARLANRFRRKPSQA